MTATTKLLPCQCGGIAAFDYRTHDDNHRCPVDTYYVRVECEQCGIATPEDDFGQVSRSHGPDPKLKGKAEAAVARVWNNRAQLPNDLFTHRAAWRKALLRCRNTSTSKADESYWMRELAVFDRVAAEIDQSCKTPDPRDERIRELEATLDRVRSLLVLSIAFYGRDAGTDREKETMKHLLASWVDGDRDILTAIPWSGDPNKRAALVKGGKNDA